MNSPHSSATSDIQQSQGIRTGKPKGSAAQYRSARISMPNTFPARERQFIRTLAEDLHLLVAWDECGEDNRNIVTWQFPGALEQPLPEEAQKTNSDAEGEGEGEGEDVDDDGEADGESKA